LTWNSNNPLPSPSNSNQILKEKLYIRHKSHTLLSPFSPYNGIFCANSLNHITSSWTRTYFIRTHKLIYALLLINWIIIKWYCESHISSCAQKNNKRVKIFDQFNVTLKPVDDEHWNFFFSCWVGYDNWKLI